MDATPSTPDPFATLPNTPARVRATTVPATPGDDVHMEIADLRRSVASNTRQIRRNAMDMVRQGRGSALRTRHLHPDFTNIPSRGSAAGTRRTPRNPNSRSYSFKPSQGRIWNASFKPSRGQKRRR